MQLLTDLVAARHPRAGLRPGAGAHPRGRPGADRRGVPRRVLVDRRGGGAGADRPRGVVLPRPRRGGDRRPHPGAALVDDRRLHARRPRTTTSTSPSTPRPSSASPATSRGRSSRCATWSRDGLAGRRHLRRARARRSAPPTSSPRPTSASGSCPTSPRRPDAGLAYVTQGNLESGFAFPGVGLALLTEHDLTGQRGTSMRDAAKMPARRRNAVDLVQLQPGDLVVHEQHGIGRYIEMISRTVNGGQRDYLIVEYAPSRRNQPPDRLFVPDRLPRPADPLRRRRGAGAVQARRRRLEEHQEQGAQGGQADRRRADPALLGAHGDARATPSARTPSGSASSRTPSRSRRPPTSSAPSTRSRPT